MRPTEYNNLISFVLGFDEGSSQDITRRTADVRDYRHSVDDIY